MPSYESVVSVDESNVDKVISEVYSSRSSLNGGFMFRGRNSSQTQTIIEETNSGSSTPAGSPSNGFRRSAMSFKVGSVSMRQDGGEDHEGNHSSPVDFSKCVMNSSKFEIVNNLIKIRSPSTDNPSMIQNPTLTSPHPEVLENNNVEEPGAIGHDVKRSASRVHSLSRQSIDKGRPAGGTKTRTRRSSSASTTKSMKSLKRTNSSFGLRESGSIDEPETTMTKEEKLEYLLGQPVESRHHEDLIYMRESFANVEIFEVNQKCKKERERFFKSIFPFY